MVEEGLAHRQLRAKARSSMSRESGVPNSCGLIENNGENKWRSKRR
jgi:hypothetical protein